MKLEFNHNYINHKDREAIFLLDEPGSYLHAEAQKKLAKKLFELSSSNIVIYCTHSHYLLDPDYIPTKYIHIADKERDNISLININKDNNIALAPIYQVLGLKYEIFDQVNKRIILTEGINDFYFLSLVNQDKTSFLPSTSVNHIEYLVPLFLSAKKEFLCLLDGDNEGNKAKEKLISLFGEDLPVITIKDILPEFKKPENMISDEDAKTIVTIMNLNEGFIKKKKNLFSKLFYAENKEDLLSKIPNTRNNIERTLEILGNKEKLLEIVEKLNSTNKI